MLWHIKRLADYIRCAAALGPTPAAKWAILWRLTKNLRVRLKLASYHPKSLYWLDTTYGRLAFRDNFGDITNLFKLIYQQEYRVRELAHPGVILDVGANIGMAAVWFAHDNPSRPIFCFEPLPANAELIRLNCPGAEVLRAAVGAQSGAVTLQVDPDSIMASSIPCRWQTAGATFDVMTLDGFAESRGIDQVALLKIDAEGMEIDIFRGAEKLLRRTGQVVLETHGRARHDEAITILRAAGFTIHSEQFAGSTGALVASRPSPQFSASQHEKVAHAS